MRNRCWFNVTAEEENRVAIVENGVLDIFEIETISRENLKGNIFKAVVDGVNPALEPPSSTMAGSAPASCARRGELQGLSEPREGSGGKGRGSRITRHLEKGMEVLVQVIRDSFGNKPPTLSTYYSLPGRYLVLMPGADSAGTRARSRTKSSATACAHPRFADHPRRLRCHRAHRRHGDQSQELQADLEALLELWRTIEKASQQVKPPALIYQERDLVCEPSATTSPPTSRRC